MDSTSSEADRLLFYSFIALLVWLPLPLASARPWAWAVMEVWIYLLAAWWLWQYARGRLAPAPALRRGRVLLLFFALWLLFGLVQLLPLPAAAVEALSPAAAAFHAETLGPGTDGGRFIPLTTDPYGSSEAWFKSLAYVLVFAAALALVTTRRRLRLLGYALVYSALFQAVYGSLMTLSGLEYGFFQPKAAYLGVATGTFVNRNHLAAYLVMALAVGIGMMIADLEPSSPARTMTQRVRRLLRLLLSPKARLRVYLAILVIGLILTHSRMGNAAFFVSLLLAGVIALLLRRRTARATVILLTSLVVIDIFLLGAWFGIDKVAERLERTSAARETRDEVVRDALGIVRNHPLVGAGAGSFTVTFPRYRSDDVPQFYAHAHNDYVQFAAESGLIGLVLLGVPVCLALVAALRVHRVRRDPLMRGMGFAGLMGITAMLIHSTVEFNLQIPANAATFMVVLALPVIALAVGKDRGRRREQERI